MNVSKKLKDLRQNSKKTLREVSQVLGVSLNSVYRWEHDLASPRKTALKILADYYGVSLEWLVNGSTEKGEFSYEEGGTTYDNAEQYLLHMYRKLPNKDRYKILGYIERIHIENMEENQSSF